MYISTGFHAVGSLSLSPSLTTSNNTNSTCLRLAEKRTKQHASPFCQFLVFAAFPFLPLIDLVTCIMVLFGNLSIFTFYQDIIHHSKRYLNKIFLFAHCYTFENHKVLPSSKSMKVFLTSSQTVSNGIYCLSVVLVLTFLARNFFACVFDMLNLKNAFS